MACFSSILEKTDRVIRWLRRIYFERQHIFCRDNSPVSALYTTWWTTQLGAQPSKKHIHLKFRTSGGRSTTWTHWPEQKWLPFCRQHFQMYFLEWKCVYLDWKCTGVCSYGSNWQCVSIDSRNGLSPNRQQAIMWTDDDLVSDLHMYHWASMS